MRYGHTRILKPPMAIQGLAEAEMRQEDLREYILSKGCHSAKENLRIYEKWFAEGPRYLFRAVDKKYHITRKVLCDVGCAYGTNLVYCAPGSYGIEIQEHEAKFASSLDLTVYRRDVLNDKLIDLPKTDVIWCSAVLEHVDSPHIFLRKLHLLLKTDGLLALYVPIIPLFPRLRHLPKLGRYFSGHSAADHINAFVPATLRFFCERAGFKTIETATFHPGFLQVFNSLPLGKQLVGGCVYIGRKITGWKYPEKATRRV